MTAPPEDDRSPEQAIWDAVQGLLEIAADDLRLGRHQLTADPPYRGVVFRAQQAAEKYCKALLARHQIEYDRSHDIDYLFDLLAESHAVLVDELVEARGLSAYAVAPRYELHPRPDNLDEAVRVLEMAEAVGQRVLEALQDYLDAGRPE